jgi:hypothetical protein
MRGAVPALPQYAFENTGTVLLLPYMIRDIVSKRMDGMGGHVVCNVDMKYEYRGICCI